MSMQTNQAAAIPAAAVALTYRQLVELFRILGGGTVGFDYSKYKLAELRLILAKWIADGAFSADYVELQADTVAAAVAQPSLPSPRVPAPVAPQPVHVAAIAAAEQLNGPLPPHVHTAIAARVADKPAQPAPLPQPFGVAAPAPQPIIVADAPHVPAHNNVENPQPAKNVQRVLSTIIPSAQPAPQHATLTFPRRVPAAQVFPEFAAQFAPDLFVTLYGNADAPIVDPDYIFTFGNVVQTLIALASTPTHRVWLGGPRGTGKTKFAEQIAARTGRPFFRVNFNRATEASEVIGDTGLRSGNTEFVYGPVAAAAVTPGALLLLDELTYGSPGNVSSLNAILERLGAHLRLPRTDRTLVPAEGFAIFVGDNTYGFGDATGEYAARNIIGSDTRDRVSIALAFDYLPAAEESKLLRAIVLRDTGKKLLKPVAAAIVNVMSAARQTANDGDLQGAPSLRGAAAFATLLAFGVPVADAFTSTVVRNAPPESAEKLRQIFAAHWPADLTQNADGSAPKFAAN